MLLKDCNLEDIVANFHQSIFVSDHEGNVIFANPMAEILLGIPKSKMIGNNVRELVREGFYDKSPILETIETKQSVMGIIKTRHGNTLIVSSQPLFDDKGNLRMVIAASIEQNLLQQFMSKLEEEKNKYQVELTYLRNRNLEKDHYVAASTVMKKLMEKINRLATTDSTIILYGESGTGKDVVAKYIYSQSLRREAPFITINCAAIPESLLESELFGYEKGAFTGAGNKAKPGLFEIADKGTLFLDEIAELPLCLQPKLLRVIENGEVRRIGATVNKKIDVRLIAATNRNLKEMVKNGTFREDLFYRLNVIPIEIPPLRERKEDIIALAQHFLNELNNKYKTSKYFGAKIINSLVKYDWPGNVRELKNIVERLFISTPGSEINSWDNVIIPLGNDERESSSADINLSKYTGITLKEFLEEAEKQYIEQVIKECNGSINDAANKLGIHRSVLYRKRKALSLL